MSSPIGHVGREQIVEALGQTWTLSRWDRSVWAAFLEWAKTQLPDPAKEAAEFLKLLEPNDEISRRAVVSQALRDRTDYLSVTSPRVAMLLDSVEGTTYLVYLLLKPKHPEVTADLAYEVVVTVGKEAMSELLKKCSGVIPKKD